MRFINAFACVFVAADCFSKGLGSDPQFIFTPDTLWIWFVIAGIWAVYAILNLWEAA